MMQFTTDTPKIAIFRALQLGDMLCAVPAMRALRQAYPKADIALIGLPWASTFVQRYNTYINRFIVFPGYTGLPEQPFNEKAWNEFVSQMQQEQFDCILQMHGNGTIVNEMLQQLQPKKLAGFHRKDFRMNQWWFIEYPEGSHEVKRHLRLMQHLGITANDAQMEFPITEQEESMLQQVAPFVHNEPYVVINPGSRNTDRQWSACYFAALGDYCAEHGYHVVLTGTSDETYITDYVANLMIHEPVNLAGKTSLGEVAALIKYANLLISNCTGVSHIAAATRTPGIVISMDGEQDRWGPMNHSLHHTFDWTKHQSFTEVHNQLITLLTTDLKKTNAIARFGAVQSGRMGFIIK